MKFRRIDFESDDRYYELERIISLSPGNLYWRSRETGKYLGCNNNLANIFGLKNRFEIEGKAPKDLIADLEVLASVEKTDNYVFETGDTLKCKEIGIDKNGQKTTYLSKKIPLFDKFGCVCGLLGNSIDISYFLKEEDKKAKTLIEETNRLKSMLIEDMGHDICTPASTAKAIVDMLVEEETDADKKEMLSDLAICVDQMYKYSQSVLDFKKIVDNAIPIQARPFILRELVDDVIQLDSLAAKAKGLELRLHYSDELPIVIKGDSYRLQRILMNFLGNAIKFTDKGYVELSVDKVHQKNVQQYDGIIKFTITDTGIGVPPEKFDFIFQPFTKLSPSNHNLYEGRGIGLYLNKKLVDELEGEINVMKRDQGAQFIVCLPFSLPLTDEIVVK